MLSITKLYDSFIKLQMFQANNMWSKYQLRERIKVRRILERVIDLWEHLEADTIYSVHIRKQECLFKNWRFYSKRHPKRVSNAYPAGTTMLSLC